MPRLPWTLFLLLMPGACSTASRPDPDIACGVYAVRGPDGPRLDPNGPIPACELPTVHNVAAACLYVAEGGIPRERPGYRIEGAACAFSNRSHSRASCAFELIEHVPGAPARSHPLRMTFVHRYGEAWEPTASGWGTEWLPEEPCPIPAGGSPG